MNLLNQLEANETPLSEMTDSDKIDLYSAVGIDPYLSDRGKIIQVNEIVVNGFFNKITALTGKEWLKIISFLADRNYKIDLRNGGW